MKHNQESFLSIPETQYNIIKGKSINDILIHSQEEELIPLDIEPKKKENSQNSLNNKHDSLENTFSQEKEDLFNLPYFESNSKKRKIKGEEEEEDHSEEKRECVNCNKCISKKEKIIHLDCANNPLECTICLENINALGDHRPASLGKIKN